MLHIIADKFKVLGCWKNYKTFLLNGFLSEKTADKQYTVLCDTTCTFLVAFHTTGMHKND